MSHSYFAIFLIAFPTLVCCGERDQDTQVGQVPLKDTPVKALSNLTVDLIDLSGNRGCRGKDCESHLWREGTTTRHLGGYDGDYSRDSGASDACEQPRDAGDCFGSRIKWYFNISSGTCRRFRYSGCGGNVNNFRSRRRCEAECNDYLDDFRGEGRVGRVGTRGRLDQSEPREDPYVKSGDPYDG